MSDLKSYQSGKGGGSGKEQNWYIGDKQGRLFIARTHPTRFGQFVFYFDNGERQMMQLLMDWGDIKLLRDLLNSMPDDDRFL